MSLLPLALIVVAIIAVAPVSSVSPNDAVHAGCYKTNLVDTQRSYYMVNESLSWENGISACINRYTTHVGVQADKRQPSKAKFFCGNDLLESVQLADSECEPCVGLKHRRCGGPQSLSLYKIRDSTPLVLYIAYEQGIKFLKYDEHVIDMIQRIRTPASRIDLLYPDDAILFQSETGGHLYKSFFGQPRTYFSDPLKIGVNVSQYGFTVDWQLNKVYYCANKQILEHDMFSGQSKQLYTTVSNCVDLAIDPYNRTLFTVFSNGTLSAFSLVTQKYRTYNGGKNYLDATRVAVDCHSQLIYIIAKLSPGSADNRLVRLDYTDTNMVILYQGDELGQYSSGLDVFEDNVVWGSWNSGRTWSSPNTYTIYACKLTPKCEQENMILLHNDSFSFDDIIIYHPKKQIPTERYLCKRCSHGCSQVALFAATCNCPEELTLGPDNATCQVIAVENCVDHEFLQVGYKIKRQNLWRAKEDEDERGKGSCEWQNPPEHGFNFHPCSKGLCSDIAGSPKSHCTTSFTRCDPGYVLIGGSGNDTCTNGQWSFEGHQCIPCGKSSGLIDRIINGNVSSRGEFPWVAALYHLKVNQWEQVCGGTLVSPSIVLTAAHCLTSSVKNLKEENVKVGLGKLNRSYNQDKEFSVIFDVKEIVRPDRYRVEDRIYELDITLLVLSKSAVTGEYIMPACMDWGAAMGLKHNEVGYLAGWGLTENDTASDVLKWAYQRYIRYNECLSLLTSENRRFISHDKFCVTQVNGALADRGDSGGGLTVLRDGAHYVYGVLSVKLTSPSETVRLFTNVLDDSHFMWLQRQWQRLLFNKSV